MEGYKVNIVEASREFTARERIMLKDTTNAIKLDEATSKSSEALIITPVDWAVLEVHNEKSDNKDYTKYVIIDADGNKYVTGSESFWTSYRDIADEMEEANEIDYSIAVYRMESKNYKGKQFLTCSIV